MLHELRQFISEKQLFSQNDTVLLTVSGGIDSIVLFDLFLKAGFNFAVAHCNFCLRGDESDKDEQFVCDLATQHGIPFHVKRFDTNTFATNHALSIQMAARELRYAWFEELATTFQYNHIATAHQLNDIIETTLINLSRGTGIAGIHGIPEKNGGVIRPLLFASRDQIHAYAENTHLKWREDQSNVDTKYARNLIRQEVVPALKKLNPNLEETFRQNTERFKGTEQLFKFHIEQYRKQLLKPTPHGFSISINDVENTPTPATILTELLLPFGFNFSTIQRIYKNKNQEAGASYYSATHLLQKNRIDWLILSIEEIEDFTCEVTKHDIEITLPGGSLTITTIRSEDFKGFSQSKNMFYTDKDLLNWPLKIRNWENGDKFQPFGMQGIKKISDFLNDIKMPSNVKRKTSVMTSNGQIIWLIGYRMSELAKITTSTKEIVIFTLNPIQQEPNNIK
jgi:tRNA(Ile)-lysidine synthase